MTEPTLDLLESVWGSITTVCDDLDEEQWDLPTDCPGWTVRSQVAHMVGTESMLLGDQAPDVDVPSDLPHVRNDIGRFNEQWVVAMRDRAGAEVLATFREVTARRLEALRSMTPEQWDEEGFTPEGPGPYRRFMEIRVFDCWYHDQDIREAVGRPGDLEGPVADFALGRVADAMGYVVGKKAGAPQGATVTFTVTGEPPIEFAIGVEGRASLLDAAPADPTVHLTFDRRTFGRLAGGRWSAERAEHEGVVSVAGDDDLGRNVVASMGYTI